jgi:hypothetical protein
MNMDDREQRIGANQALFRRVNERLEDLNEAFGAITESVELVCECGRRECAERIEMSPSEYEGIRDDPALFAVVRGHEAANVEEVVEQRNGYDVVRKRPGLPRRIAETTDPR